MSVRLSVGDVVLVKPYKDRTYIGLIKYVGPMIDHDILVEYVGIELLESIPNGHNGTIGGFQYFTTSKGYGFHTKITKVIKKLSIKDLFAEMKQLYSSFQKKMKRILKLENVLNNYKNNTNTPPPKIDTSLPSVSPSSRSQNSNCSYQSRLSHAYSMATSLTTYSHNTSYKNVYSNVVKKLPYESTNSNSTSDKSIKNNKTHQRTKSSSSYSSKSLSLNDSDSDSNYCLEINEENKHKTEYKPKHKKSKANRLSRSQSHSHHSENPISPRTKQILRMRSKTIEHKPIDTQYEQYNNNIQYSVNNIINKIPPRQPMISESKSTPLVLISQSAPSSPFMTGINTNTSQMYPSHSAHNSHHSAHNSYHSAHNSHHLEQPQMIVNTMGLPQSNTQVIEESDLTYNIYNHTPSSSSHNNMLMVNNTYSPYGHHYNDHSGSYISHGSHVSHMSNVSLGGNSNPSLSPYHSQLAAYNEYYGRNSRNSNGMMQSPTPMIPNHKMYHIQKNGQEIVYQHK